jgi:RNA polymerase sigma-70 factor (ECF subfamily)
MGGGLPAGPAPRRVGLVSEDDRDAVRRVQAGDTEAFEPLVEKYKRKVFRLAYQVLRDQEEALDVAQEAFVKAFRALPAFKGDSAFYTWLFRITMNVALDRKRQRATRVKSLGTDDVTPEEWERTATSTDPDPEDVASGAERRERIRKGLDSLSEHHRTIIILSDIEGLQYREIAEVLGIPMGTVMSRLHHARKRLREVLGSGFALVLATLAWLLVAAGPVRAQLPPLPPPGVLPPPTAAPGAAPTQVCVYALVVYASNPPAGAARPGAPPGPPGSPPSAGLAPPPGPPGSPPSAGLPPLPGPPGSPPSGGLTPTPDLANPAAPPATGAPAPDLQTGCGQPVRLRLWVPRLQEVFQYSHYEPVSAFETRMPVGMVQRFALPGGRELEIQPLGIRRPIVRVLMRVKRGPVGELTTVMDVPPRRPALIGGLAHQNGVLIIAIRAREE